MHIERIRPTVLQITLHVYEMAAVVAAIRWALEGATGELSPDARAQLRKILDSYEASIASPSGP